MRGDIGQHSVDDDCYSSRRRVTLTGSSCRLYNVRASSDHSCDDSLYIQSYSYIIAIYSEFPPTDIDGVLMHAIDILESGIMRVRYLSLIYDYPYER